MALAFCDGTHVAFCSKTSDRLLRLGAKNVVQASDRLGLGPSRLVPAEHARAREVFWGSSGKWDQLFSSEVRWLPPLVLWVSASIHERVNLWRTLHYLRETGVDHQSVFPLEFETSPASSPFDCIGSVAHHPDDVLSDRLASARPWSRTRYTRATILWEQFVNPDPVPFVRTCLDGTDGFPELGQIWGFLSAFLPKYVDRTLRLSRFDELLLHLLSGWRTPLEVYVDDSPAGEELQHLGACTGDLFFPRRLDHWAFRGEDPAVERVATATPDRPMKAFAYRITERGRRLRDRGLDRLSDAPPLPVAGIEAYSGPWVLLEDGRVASNPIDPHD